MSEAMKLIVDGYLSLKNRNALEDLRAHRQRLRKQLQDRFEQRARRRQAHDGAA